MTQPIQSDIWRWNSQTALPPINGQVRSDTAEWQSPTSLYVEYTTDAGADQTSLLLGIVAGDIVTLTMKTDATRYAQYAATAASVDCGTYAQIPVARQDSNGSLPNSGTLISVGITPLQTAGSLTGTWIWRPGNYSWYEPPGEVSTDNQTWVWAGALAISTQTSDGQDASTGLANVQPGDTLRMGVSGAESPFILYTVTEAGALEQGYMFFPVTPAGGNGNAPVDGTLVDIECPYTVPTPPDNTISWSVQRLDLRPNRYLLVCWCQHGTISEQCAIALVGQPVPPMATIESTANNLLRATGCTCAGLVAAALPTTEFAAL